MPAPMPSPPPVTTATRPSSSRFQSSTVWDALVTRHSDGPYAACERIASSMTDSEGSSVIPDDATSCGSRCSWCSCSGCSISLQSPGSSTSRIFSHCFRHGPRCATDLLVVSAVLGAVFVPGPILAATSGVLFGPVLGLS